MDNFYSQVENRDPYWDKVNNPTPQPSWRKQLSNIYDRLVAPLSVKDSENTPSWTDALLNLSPANPDMWAMIKSQLSGQFPSAARGQEGRGAMRHEDLMAMIMGRKQAPPTAMTGMPQSFQQPPQIGQGPSRDEPSSVPMVNWQSKAPDVLNMDMLREIAASQFMPRSIGVPLQNYQTPQDDPLARYRGGIQWP